MKHLQSINEYDRTVGFRYSDPTEKFNIKVYINGELTEEEIKNTLNETDVIVLGDIRFEDTPDDYMSDDEDDEVNVISFDICVYNEKEIERIIEAGEYEPETTMPGGGLLFIRNKIFTNGGGADFYINRKGTRIL
jgi:hypothetical protein